MEFDSFQEKDKNIKFIQDLEETCKADQNDVVETEQSPEINNKDNSPTHKQIFKQKKESIINKKRKREKKKKSPKDQKNRVDNNTTEALNNENENSKGKNDLFTKIFTEFDKLTLVILEIKVLLSKGKNNKNDESISYEKVAKDFISHQNDIINKFLESKKEKSKNLDEKNDELENLKDTNQGEEQKLNKLYNDMNKTFKELIDKINYNIERKDNKRIETYFKPNSSLFEYLNKKLELDFDFNFHKQFIKNYGSSVKRLEELNNLFIYQFLDILYEKKGKEKENEKAYKLIKSMKESKELYNNINDSKIYTLYFFLTRKCKEIFDYYYENNEKIDINKYPPNIDIKSFIDYFKPYFECGSRICFHL